MKVHRLVLASLLSVVIAVSAAPVYAQPSSPAVTNEDSEDPAWERWAPIPILVQSVAGLVGGLGLGYVVAVTTLGNGFDQAGIFLTAGAVLTGSAGGVWVTGQPFDGDGGFLWTLTGSTLGGALMVSLALGLHEAKYQGAGYIAAVGIPAFITVGGIMGYHLSSSEVIPSVGAAPTKGGASAFLGWTF